MNQTALSLAPDLRRELETLVRIPSVSRSGFDPSMVRASAEASMDLYERSGFQGIRTLEIDGSLPSVYAEIRSGGPTVLLYAHHDVQPPGPDEAWETNPFEPVENGGRLFGRGTADNKCGVVTHAMMGKIFDGHSPVNLKVLVEGEEEIGSPNLARLLSAHGDRLRADAIIIADAGNWSVGQPAITTSFRGMITLDVEVRTADAGVHSGIYGGPIPDALSALVRILSTLQASNGSTNIAGLVTADEPELEISETSLRSQFKPVDGLEFIGTGSVTSRMWSQPSVAVLAIDAPTTEQAINQLVPMARAKIGLRLAPGQKAGAAMKALSDHLLAARPWGAEVSIVEGAMSDPFLLRNRGSYLDGYKASMQEAWGVKPVEMGSGGSIPFVSAFARAFPNSAIILVGAGDPTSGAHGPNESLDLDDFAKATLAEALALTRFGS